MAGSLSPQNHHPPYPPHHRSGPPPPDQIILTPLLPTPGMIEERQITEENGDFQGRSRYHHSRIMSSGDQLDWEYEPDGLLEKGDQLNDAYH